MVLLIWAPLLNDLDLRCRRICINRVNYCLHARLYYNVTNLYNWLSHNLIYRHLSLFPRIQWLMIIELLTSCFAMISFPSWLTPTSTFYPEEMATSVWICFTARLSTPHCKCTIYFYWEGSETVMLFSWLGKGLMVTWSAAYNVTSDAKIVTKMIRVSLPSLNFAIIFLKL